MLNSLKIKRFRALEDFSVSRLGRVNLIVGKNNAGKSTVLEALQIYAAGGRVSLLETLAKQHGEWVSHERAHDWAGWDAQQLASRQQDGSAPFVGFFSGRIFPDSDEGIEIGENAAESRLYIEHGYYLEWQAPIHGEADMQALLYRRVSKDKTAEAETASQTIAKAASPAIITATPSVRVGPGRMVLTVTPVPASTLARPRDRPCSAALLTP